MAERKAGVLHTDGACIGNPGPAGAGFVLLDAEGRVVREGSLALGPGTNNMAEYQAVIAGLEAAAAEGFTDLSVRSDSELLCRQMWGRYRVKSPALERLHLRVRELMGRFANVKFEHVPREANHRADRLAVEGAKQSRNSAHLQKSRSCGG